MKYIISFCIHSLIGVNIYLQTLLVFAFYFFFSFVWDFNSSSDTVLNTQLLIIQAQTPTAEILYLCIVKSTLSVAAITSVLDFLTSENTGGGKCLHLILT